jgi:hypothetical protein
MQATDKNISTLKNTINAKKQRSAWGKGVQYYTNLLLDNFQEWINLGGAKPINIDEETALNGAQDWSSWAYGGCGLVCNYAICDTLCTESEKKITKNGLRKPNARENWLDVEARAVRQAWAMIENAKNEITK